jgi:D-beta-D-heptose 7-phosphate kinase/D-beta-D-heptose 1-phosphate adenosyltransferase
VNLSEKIAARIMTRPQLLQQAARWRIHDRKIVFTNGVFDLLHPGHLFSLEEAAKEGDYLVVGLNSDASVKRLKGPDRPIQDEQTRAYILASLLVVDAVVIFEEDTPRELVMSFLPDVMVKGGDYAVGDVAGGKEVIDAGGRVVINPIREGFSTTSLITQLSKK